MATHYPEAIPRQNHTARSVTQALSTVFAHFGLPEEILSDQTLGFSPFEMLFGRDVRGPLQLIKSRWEPTAVNRLKTNVLDFMLNIRNNLKTCQEIAEQVTQQARSKSKLWYHRKERERSYEPGQLVLVCLPVQGNPLEAKYCDPYRVLERIEHVEYLIATPDRRKTQRICHVNMLKAYIQRDSKFMPQSATCVIDSDITASSDLDANSNDYGPSAPDTDTDSYTMPRIDDLIDKVEQAKFLTKIDLSRGYWQVLMDPESIPVSVFVTAHSLLDCPRPNNPKQSSYLSLAGYYRRFIPHFADIAACLTNLLRKATKFLWTAETEATFLDLKSRLASRPVLRPPNCSQPFMLVVLLCPKHIHNLVQVAVHGIYANCG